MGSTQKVSPTEFAHARLDEDKAAANEIHRPRDCGSVDRDGEFDPDPIWCSCDYPARALREAETGRRILERHWPDGYGCQYCADGGHNVGWGCADLADLLARWSDHPDYDPGWKP